MKAAALRTRLTPVGLDPARSALWHAAHDDWDNAHEAAQADTTPAADWVHAHLHRVEGDLENARYWYSRAGKPMATGPLDLEWAAIAEALEPA
jgi:hypothetical protein